MRLQELTKTSGEWLRGTGPDSDIVISSRIRLARNLAQFPFGNRADKHEQQEIEELLCQYFQKLKGKWKFHYFNVEELDNLDRQLLVERQLISRELADSEGVRGVAFVRKENISVMVNEEDHLRIQVMNSGLDLDATWEQTDAIDDVIEEHLSYAFHQRLGLSLIHI